MNLKGKVIIQNNGELINDVHYYLGQIKNVFDSLNFWTNADFEVLKFNRIVKYHSHRRVNFESLYLIRHGLIKTKKQSENQFDVSYSISLNYLLFFSVLVGFAVSSLGVIFSIYPIFIGIISALIVFVYGFVGIERNTKRIIKSVFQKFKNERPDKL